MRRRIRISEEKFPIIAGDYLEVGALNDHAHLAQRFACHLIHYLSVNSAALRQGMGAGEELN